MVLFGVKRGLWRDFVNVR
jgi:hypothetical protein